MITTIEFLCLLAIICGMVYFGALEAEAALALARV